MCDALRRTTLTSEGGRAADGAWDALSKIPFALTAAVAVDVFLVGDTYPGGSAPFFIAILLLLLIVRAIKEVSYRLGPDSPGSWALRPVKEGYSPSPGFPSSHSAVMGFFVVALAARGWNGTPPAGKKSSARRVVVVSFLAACAALVGASRWITKCHTLLQVFVGLGIGFAAGGGYAALVRKPSTQ